jgi:hypothetical protein
MWSTVEVLHPSRDNRDSLIGRTKGEHLGVTAVAVRNPEERAVLISGHQRQADRLLVEPLHGIQIVNAKCNLAERTLPCASRF